MNIGNVEAVCTSATITGEVVNEVISQAAATSFIHMQTLAISHADQSMRNTGCAIGASAVVGGGEDAAAGPFTVEGKEARPRRQPCGGPSRWRATYSPMAIDAVSPGDSMPNRLTSPATP